MQHKATAAMLPPYSLLCANNIATYLRLQTSYVQLPASKA